MAFVLYSAVPPVPCSSGLSGFGLVMEERRVIARNLRRLRKSAEFSISELSERSNVSASQIQKIESANAVPPTNVLFFLAQVLRCSVFDLLKEVPVFESVRFPRTKNLAPLDRLAVIDNAVRKLRDYHSLEVLTGNTLSFFSLPSASIEPEELAELFRKVLGLDARLPITAPVPLFERTGIKLLSFPIGIPFVSFSVNDSLTGSSVIINDSPKISTEQKIFSAFKEVGHLISHSGSYHIAEESENPEEESFAEEFASFFLMPPEGFRDIWYKTRGFCLCERICAVKQYFRISYRLVIARAVQEGFAGKDLLRKFRLAYAGKFGMNLPSKRDIFQQEPEPISRYIFEEDRFRRLTLDAVQDGLMTPVRGAELLNLTLYEFNDLRRYAK